ncbi:MAG: hypothetical protein U1F56_00510 [Rubrivivax sp.]
MNKLGWLGAALSVLLMSGGAMAQSCPSGTTRVTSGTPADGGTSGGNFAGFITNARVCASRGTDRWQEWHQSGGPLFDWKLGPGHAMDPRKQVGTWTSSNGANATVTHTYGSNSYVWAICRTNAAAPFDYTMVSPTGGTVTGVRILVGDGACP